MEAQREALMIKRDGDEGRLMKRLQSQEQTRFMSEIHELTEANEFLKGLIHSFFLSVYNNFELTTNLFVINYLSPCENQENFPMNQGTKGVLNASYLLLKKLITVLKNLMTMLCNYR